MKIPNIFPIAAALILGAATLTPDVAVAGSCCGGGSAVSLMVPKYARGVADLSFDTELYDGFWNQSGRHVQDPPGSDLRQYRLNLGYGHRLTQKWQMGITVPYVWNDNTYSGVSSQTDGLGDITLSTWYELLEDKSAWRVQEAVDMIPSLHLGLSLLLPTGISPYDDVSSSFDVTGRGFYRLEGNLLVEKTLHPWNASVTLGYGTYFDRSVNREYGKYVEPYTRGLGDRFSASVAFGHNLVLGTGGDNLTTTVAYSYLNEAAGNYNGRSDTTNRFDKQAVGLTLAYANNDNDWSIRVGWNHAIGEDGWGENFPTTDIVTVGVRYVFR